MADRRSEMDCAHVVVVGAGPYGLSIAAYLRDAGVPFRIFGSPMHTWRERMPDGMILKSDGFASNLADPKSAFTLRHFCESAGIAYADMNIPIRLETLRAYGLAFQRRLVPELDDTQVVRIERHVDGFGLELGDGGRMTAHNVVLAVGISHFHVLPPPLRHLPADLVTHSSAHKDVGRFRGRQVAVLGGGASGIDLAVLLKDVGADVVLIARRASLRFNDPPLAHRSPWVRMRYPSSAIGPGWRPLFYANAPGLFYRLPETVRRRVVRAYLGSAAGWPMKERFVGRVPALLEHDVEKAEVRRGRVCLMLRGRNGTTEHRADHVIAATGYEVDLRRLTFLGEDLLSGIDVVDRAPVLSPHFETSIPGLYCVGIVSKHAFGPVMQFACGARWTTERISRRLARSRSRRPMASSARGAVWQVASDA